MLSAYRLNAPVTVVVIQEGRHRLLQLPAGSVFQPKAARLDRNRMIEGTCKGDIVLVFSRDLEDCANPITAKPLRILSMNA